MEREKEKNIVTYSNDDSEEEKNDTEHHAATVDERLKYKQQSEI